MGAFDLATVAQVKLWLSVGAGAQSSNPNDELLAALISQVSQVILTGYLLRTTVLWRPYTDTIDGQGGNRLMLRQWPVTDIVSVSIGQTEFQPSQGGQQGYLLSPWDGYLPGRQQNITMIAGCFPRGSQNVSMSYNAGYLAKNESQLIPSDGIVAVAQSFGPWVEDVGVKFSDGTVVTKVTSAPSAGEYRLTENKPGSYTFNVSDAAKTALISYSYVPSPLNQAVIETVGERYRYRSRIGLQSETVPGPQTNSFSLKDLQDYVKAAIAPYRRLTPV